MVIMRNLNSSNFATSPFWHSLFDAGSIAVIGANDIVGSWGYDSLRAALGSLKTLPSRQIYAVNPNIPEMQGLKSFKTILDIPGPVELVIIVVRADLVPSVMRQCVQKGSKAAVIISAGFAEVDEAGAKLQDEIVAIARQGGIRFVGPNCLGHADAHTQVASAGVVGRVDPGPMAVLSQSGTLGASIVQMAFQHGIGLSKFVGTGNEADLHLEDYLEYLAQDNDTNIITAYIEGLREARRFFQLAQKITLKKPIIVLKTGTTAESSRAAKSHTGALAGSDAVYTAAFKQSGVIRTEDEGELCDVAAAILNQPLPRDNRIGILTMGGGFGVVTAEALEKEGLRIASLETKTIEKMNSILPPRWSHANPVDLVGMKSTGENTIVSSCLTYMLEDANIDAIISFLPPVGMQPGFGPTFTPGQAKDFQAESLRRLEAFHQQIRQSGKPVYLIRRFMHPGPNGAGSEHSANKTMIPEYSTPRQVARVLKHLTWYREYLDTRK